MHTYAHAHAARYAHARASTHTHTHSHSHSHSHTLSLSLSLTLTLTHTHTHTHTHTPTHTHTRTHTHAHTHTHTSLHKYYTYLNKTHEQSTHPHTVLSNCGQLHPVASYVWCSGLWIEVVPLGGRASLVLIHPLNLSRAGSKRHTPGLPSQQACYKPREGVMLTRHHWVKNLHDAGCWPRRMKFPQELNGYVFKTKVSHLDRGLCGLAWRGMGSAMRHCPRHTTWK